MQERAQPQRTEASSSSFTGRELYILLSDKCNFSCAHCLNSSGPKATRWRPTEDSVLALAEEINRASDVQMLHFSGGEPTLFLAQIKQLLSLVKRPLPSAITTNGWFVDRSIGFLDELPLTSVVISYDRYHAPFMALEKLVPLVQYLQAQGRGVSFNFVFSNLSELSDIAPIKQLGVQVHLSRVIKSGRGNGSVNWHDERAIDETCPSLVPEQRRTPDLEKAIYISERGFTPCCGPLVFDELASVESVFSKNLSDYPANPLLRELKKGSFREQAAKLGFDLSKVDLQSSCDACALIHGSIATGVPSLRELVSQEKTYYPFTGELSSNQEQLLLQQYVVGYTETLDQRKLAEILASSKTEQPGPSGLAVTELQSADIPSVIDFVKANYYANYPEHYSESAVKEFTDFCPEYLSWPSVRGVVYRKGGQIVGTVFSHLYDPHPALGIPTVHIGYWGYDRTQVTQTEARWIKEHWLRSLAGWSGGSRAIDASFDCFNSPAIKFARAIGFERKMLRLDRKAV